MQLLPARLPLVWPHLQMTLFDPAQSSTYEKLDAEACSNVTTMLTQAYGNAFQMEANCSAILQYGDPNSLNLTVAFMTDTLSLPGAVGSISLDNVLMACINSGTSCHGESAVCGLGGGIAGVDRTPSSLLMQMAAQGMIDPAVGFCLTHDTGSQMVLGAAVPEGVDLQTSPLGKPPNDTTQYYAQVESVFIDGQSAVCYENATLAVVDTGYSGLSLAAPAYLAWADGITAPKEDITFLAEMGAFCANVSLQAAEDMFPTITLYLADGAEVNITSQQYLLQSATDMTCALVFATPATFGEESAGSQYWLGDPFFRERFVQLDIATDLMRVSGPLVCSDVEGYTAEPEELSGLPPPTPACTQAAFEAGTPDGTAAAIAQVAELPGTSSPVGPGCSPSPSPPAPGNGGVSSGNLGGTVMALAMAMLAAWAVGLA